MRLSFLVRNSVVYYIMSLSVSSYLEIIFLHNVCNELKFCLVTHVIFIVLQTKRGFEKKTFLGLIYKIKTNI